MIYSDIEDAITALRTAEMDCAADFGEEGVEAAHHDLVMTIAENCSPGVATELIRREL